MKTARRAAKASSLMAASLGIVSICRFVRNIVLARMLLPEDFGVGATFALTLTFLELLTELGPAKQLVQAKEGNLAVWQGVAHTIIAVRGALIAAALFLAAGTIAGWLGVPDATVAFQCLALAPLMRGFEHLDVCRFQRDLRLGRLALVEAAPPFVSLLAAPFAAVYFGDYRAFLVVTLISAGGRLLVSHRVATRPYGMSVDRPVLMRFLGFGWPLIGNSLLMFLILHGERLLVAAKYDLATLGAYSVALALGFTPAMMLARMHGSVALPLLSRAQDDPAALRRRMASSSQVMCLSAGLLAIGFVAAGSWLVGLCYGENYLLSQQVVPWIGLMCAVRVVRATPAMTAIALGDTRIALYSNLSRAASFGVAAWLVYRGSDIAWVPVCGFAGELAAYLTSLVLLKTRHAAPVEESFKCFVGVAVVVALVAAIVRGGGLSVGIASPLSACCGGAVLIAGALCCWENLRGMVRALVAMPREAGRS